MIGPEMQREKVIIKGIYWSAGDRVFIDIHKDVDQSTAEWECLDLAEFMRENIPDNSVVELELTVTAPKSDWEAEDKDSLLSCLKHRIEKLCRKLIKGDEVK